MSDYSPLEEWEAPLYESERPFWIRWRVHSLGNRAVQPFYHIDVRVFIHRWEDTCEYAILADQGWLDAHENDLGAESAEYVKSYLDGTVVKPGHVFEHPRIDPPADPVEASKIRDQLLEHSQGSYATRTQ